MKKLPIIALIAALAVGCAPKDNVYQFTVTDNKVNEVCLDQYKGQVMLIVNTATQCGFTPQYSELDELYDTYKEQGFTILDFPCNQFGAQAPGICLSSIRGLSRAFPYRSTVMIIRHWSSGQ